MRSTLVLVLLVCGACNGDVRSAQSAVRDYNAASILAYRTGDLSKLKPVTGDEELRRIETLLDLKRGAGLVLESSLLSWEALSAEATGPDGYVIETDERWRYFDRALTPGQSPGPRFVADMRMRYELARAGKGWRVLKVRTITNQVLEPAGHRLAHNVHGEERREP